jgi:hypothetical protein
MARLQIFFGDDPFFRSTRNWANKPGTVPRRNLLALKIMRRRTTYSRNFSGTGGDLHGSVRGGVRGCPPGGRSGLR